MTADGTHGYVYDAENRLTCVWGTDGTCTSASAMLYLYDAQGQRVGKQQADTLEDYVYDPQGHIISVHDGIANLLRSELYSPDGRHVATWNPSAIYFGPLYWNHADWLGTERVRTDSTGTAREWNTDTPYGGKGVRSPFRYPFPGATGSGECFPIRTGPPPSAPIAPSHTAGSS